MALKSLTEWVNYYLSQGYDYPIAQARAQKSYDAERTAELDAVDQTLNRETTTTSTTSDEPYVPYQSSIDLYEEQQIHAIIENDLDDQAARTADMEPDVYHPPTTVTEDPVRQTETVTTGDTGTTGGGGTTTTTTTTGGGSEEPQNEDPVDPFGDPIGIMPGGTLVKVVRSDNTEFWVQSYSYGGRNYTERYDSYEQVQQILGAQPAFQEEDETWWRGVVDSGSATDIQGLDRSFNNYFDEVVYEAALAAGINDPSMIGRMIQDPEMQGIIVEAAIEDWSDQQLLAAQRNTTFWKDVLYPGIENLYGSSADPEYDYLNYEEAVTPYLSQIGYIPTGGSYRDAIGDMLDSGVDAQTFAALTPTYLKAINSEDYMNEFARWTSEEFGQEITFDEWFDLLGGMAQPDLLAAAERSTISYLSQQTGTGISDEQVMRLAAETDLSESQIREAFSEIDQALTALAGGGLSNYDLTQDDLFSLKSGIKPLSGMDFETIRTRSAQAARELGLLDDEKLKLYTGYDPELGSPFKPGLFGLAPPA